jgi:hypothetical protein
VDGRLSTKKSAKRKEKEDSLRVLRTRMMNSNRK